LLTESACDIHSFLSFLTFNPDPDLPWLQKVRNAHSWPTWKRSVQEVQTVCFEYNGDGKVAGWVKMSENTTGLSKTLGDMTL
jgi:hypothetical protein